MSFSFPITGSQSTVPRSKPRKIPVNAAPWQVAILQTLRDQTTHPNEDLRNRTSIETGLDDEWIKSWFRRQNKRSKRNSLNISRYLGHRGVSASDASTRSSTPAVLQSTPSSAAPSPPAQTTNVQHHASSSQRNISGDSCTSLNTKMNRSETPLDNFRTDADMISESLLAGTRHDAQQHAQIGVENTALRPGIELPFLYYLPPAFPLWLFRSPSERADLESMSSQEGPENSDHSILCGHEGHRHSISLPEIDSAGLDVLDWCDSPTKPTHQSIENGHAESVLNPIDDSALLSFPFQTGGDFASKDPAIPVSFSAKFSDLAAIALHLRTDKEDLTSPVESTQEEIIPQAEII